MSAAAARHDELAIVENIGAMRDLEALHDVLLDQQHRQPLL